MFVCHVLHIYVFDSVPTILIFELCKLKIYLSRFIVLFWYQPIIWVREYRFHFIGEFIQHFSVYSKSKIEVYIVCVISTFPIAITNVHECPIMPCTNLPTKWSFRTSVFCPWSCISICTYFIVQLVLWVFKLKMYKQHGCPKCLLNFRTAKTFWRVQDFYCS